MTPISATNTIALGSDYVWDEPTPSDGTYYESIDLYDAADNFDTESSVIIQELTEMRQNGQTSICIPLYPINGWGDYQLTLENSAGGNFQPEQLQDLADYVAAIKALGFTSILYRFMFQGSSSFSEATAGSPDQVNNNELIANLTNEIFQPSGINYLIDLSGEAINEYYTPATQLLDQSMWTTYIAEFGTSHTAGLSTNHLWDQNGVDWLEQVYQGTYPAEFAIELYSDGSMPTIYEQVVNLNRELNAAGINRPWVISETDYDNPVIAADLKQAIADTGQIVTALYQWPGVPEPLAYRTIPLQISAYSMLNNVTPNAQLLTASQTVDLTGYEAIQGGASALTFDASTVDNIVTGGLGGITFLESGDGTGNLVTTASTSVNTIDVIGWDRIVSYGSDEIDAPTGSSDIIVNGSAEVNAGSGYNTVQVNGLASIQDSGPDSYYIINGTALVSFDSGQPNVTIGASGRATLFGSVGQFSLSSEGGSVSFDVSEASASYAMQLTGVVTSVSVADGNASITTASGGNGATITANEGNAIIGSNGPDTIYGGPSSSVVTVANSATIYDGIGQMSVQGDGTTASANVFGNGGTTTFSGNFSTFNYYGGVHANVVTGDIGQGIVIGGTGRMTVEGGRSEQIVGGSGGLAYTDSTDGSGNTIITSALTKNVIDLAGSDDVTSNGFDIIMGGTGDSTLVINGAAVFYGSTGHTSITINGVATLRGVGQDSVVVNSGASAVISAGALTDATERGGLLDFSEGSGSSMSSVTVNGGVAEVVGGTSAGISVTSNSNAPVTITDGAGPLSIKSMGADIVLGGTGTLSLVSSGAGMQFVAGNGSASINLEQNGGSIELGSGATFVQVSAFGSADVFSFLAGHGGGQDVITGFRVGVDTLTLGAGLVVSSASVDDAGSHFMLSDNSQLLLAGVMNFPSAGTL